MREGGSEESRGLRGGGRDGGKSKIFSCKALQLKQTGFK